MDTKKVRSNILALTDESVVRFSSVMHVARELTNEAVEESDLLVITQASSLSQLPLESSSMDNVIFVCTLPEFSGDALFKEILRILKPGGIILVHKTSKVMNGQTYQTSTLENKILIAGFVEPQVIQLKTVVPSDDIQYTGIKANKPSWKIGSSFSIKKATKALPKVQIDDDMDLIDEDSLLTEEDLKKPQLLPADDCEAGSTRKACKNCSCGRAEAEAKVEKLGLTDDQLDNPQSACGSCGLGDAFRCGTCPYKGLPAFKLGEKVSLSQNFLLADI